MTSSSTRTPLVAGVSAPLSFAAEDSYAVVLAEEGNALVQALGRCIELEPGCLTVLPPSPDVRVHPRSGSRALVAVIPEVVLAPWLPGNQHATGRAIPAETSELAADMLRWACDHADGVAAPELAAVLARVVAAAALCELGAEEEHGDPQLRAEIRRHVEWTLRRGTPATPAAVARHFGISVRRLHLLFGSEELTFSQAVMRTRAQLCALDIEANPSMPLGRVARRWGFADSSHMTRSLRLHIGRGPREL